MVATLKEPLSGQTSSIPSFSTTIRPLGTPTTSATGQHYTDIDGFIRYTHFAEEAYDETEQEIQVLLSEHDQKLGPT
jgi:hypothetical protein